MIYNTVSTLFELLSMDAIALRLPKHTTVAVLELDGVLPKKQPWSEARHWTNRFIFTVQSGIAADNDIIYPARGGGHWVRLRDIT